MHGPYPSTHQQSHEHVQQRRQLQPSSDRPSQRDYGLERPKRPCQRGRSGLCTPQATPRQPSPKKRGRRPRTKRLPNSADLQEVSSMRARGLEPPRAFAYRLLSSGPAPQVTSKYRFLELFPKASVFSRPPSLGHLGDIFPARGRPVRSERAMREHRKPAGHVFVAGRTSGRVYFAKWRDGDGQQQKRLGPAWVKPHGHTARGAVRWRGRRAQARPCLHDPRGCARGFAGAARGRAAHAARAESPSPGDAAIGG